tara:strand:+ start:52 stop:276 length:225 start_codon:yes stop_codon:yes gene_type:complete
MTVGRTSACGVQAPKVSADGGGGESGGGGGGLRGEGGGDSGGGGDGAGGKAGGPGGASTTVTLIFWLFQQCGVQ